MTVRARLRGRLKVPTVLVHSKGERRGAGGVHDAGGSDQHFVGDELLNYICLQELFQRELAVECRRGAKRL